MTTRTVETEHDRKMLRRFIEGHKLPFIAELTAGKRRSVEQNKLQRKWMTEVSEQLGDRTPEEVRAYCKLTIGVPILRDESETFREKYDAIVRPLPYEQKIAIMSEPLDMPVTRLMTSRQKHAYLDAIFQHFSEKGVVLTIPPDKRYGPAIDEQEPAPEVDPLSEGAAGAPLTPSADGAPNPSAAADQEPEAEVAPPAEASGSDLVNRNLMIEARDKFLALATDKDVADLKARRGNVEFAKDAWKDALPSHHSFVKACMEAADRIIKGGAVDGERDYLDGLIERAAS